MPEGAGCVLIESISGAAKNFLKVRAGTIPAVINGQSVVVGGDIVVEVQGVKLNQKDSFTKLRAKLRNLKAGATLTAKVRRQGRLVQLKGTLPE